MKIVNVEVYNFLNKIYQKLILEKEWKYPKQVIPLVVIKTLATHLQF